MYSCKGANVMDIIYLGIGIALFVIIRLFVKLVERV